MSATHSAALMLILRWENTAALGSFRKNFTGSVQIADVLFFFLRQSTGTELPSLEAWIQVRGSFLCTHPQVCTYIEPYYRLLFGDVEDQ